MPVTGGLCQVGRQLRDTRRLIANESAGQPSALHVLAII